MLPRERNYLWLSRDCSDRLSLWFLKSLHSRLFKKQTQKVLYHKRTLFTLFSGEPYFIRYVEPQRSPFEPQRSLFQP